MHIGFIYAYIERPKHVWLDLAGPSSCEVQARTTLHLAHPKGMKEKGQHEASAAAGASAGTGNQALATAAPELDAGVVELMQAH